MIGKIDHQLAVCLHCSAMSKSLHPKPYSINMFGSCNPCRIGPLCSTPAKKWNKGTYINIYIYMHINPTNNYSTSFDLHPLLTVDFRFSHSIPLHSFPMTKARPAAREPRHDPGPRGLKEPPRGVAVLARRHPGTHQH